MTPQHPTMPCKASVTRARESKLWFLAYSFFIEEVGGWGRHACRSVVLQLRSCSREMSLLFLNDPAVCFLGSLQSAASPIHLQEWRDGDLVVEVEWWTWKDLALR
ncbi:hypothetical protein DPSP01_014771 [Paraphaeosphaeria sporulosa]